jgi:hypothetical protein
VYFFIVGGISCSSEPDALHVLDQAPSDGPLQHWIFGIPPQTKSNLEVLLRMLHTIKSGGKIYSKDLPFPCTQLECCVSYPLLITPFFAGTQKKTRIRVMSPRKEKTHDEGKPSRTSEKKSGGTPYKYNIRI